MLRSAWAIVRDVRSHGADLRADFYESYVFPTAPVPSALVQEIKQRRLDLLAIFEEFHGESLLPAHAVAAAERLVSRKPTLY